ncbi:MAG TPA: hypothetical protein DCW90_08700 [Lachnospiraceae bacterium]|nr:hypothetical protein [Lachnospiraceae bacterium]
MICNLKAQEAFTIKDVIPRYRLEHLAGNIYYLKAHIKPISSMGTFSTYGKTLYIRSLICSPENLGDRAFSDTPEKLLEKVFDKDISLYSKAWCCNESE